MFGNDFLFQNLSVKYPHDSGRNALLTMLSTMNSRNECCIQMGKDSMEVAGVTIQDTQVNKTFCSPNLICACNLL